jgi:hypothetical protein
MVNLLALCLPPPSMAFSIHDKSPSDTTSWLALALLAASGGLDRQRSPPM